MGDLQRWSVTYTKHMKQKRKVYQDGFLEHHTSTNKLVLYDDSEKLLECRLLKKDEAVSCGETLTFSSHLVDVNLLDDGGHKPPSASASASLGRDCEVVEKSRLRPTLSPSQKIIRVVGKKISEFKKKEARKYSTTPTATTSDDIKSSTREWEVLYTTQVTQKAKKYHDGFLRLSIQGSFGRQVMLFDASRNLLDSRFLKKDEVIESGEAISFDAHLVEIGEPQGDHKPLRESNCNVIKEEGNMHGEHSHAHINKAVETGFVENEFHKLGSSNSSKDTTESSSTEWNVLYTTQLTQKAKKYHDGFLHLANFGCRGRQAMLYDSTRKLLDSRFLKNDEVVKAGESFAFGAHLVDTGEPEDKSKHPVDFNVQGKGCNVLHMTGKKHIQEEYLALNKGKPHNHYCLGKDVDSNFMLSSADKMQASKMVPKDKPLRDVNQILSILQKPQTRMVEGYSNNNMNKPVSPTKEHPVSDDVDLYVPEDDQPPRSSLAQHESSEHVDTTGSRETKDLKRPLDLTPSIVPSSGSDDLLVMGTETGNSHQLYSDMMEANTKMCDEAYGFDASTSTTLASYGLDDDDRKSSEELTCARETNEGPSFDLGF